jgi:hypothetical protein
MIAIKAGRWETQHRKSIVNGLLRCSWCKTDRPLNEFGLNRYRLTGFDAYCKDCRSILRRLKPQNTKRPSGSCDPIKVAARVKLQRAVRVGRIVKPSQCGKCGAKGVSIDGHHKDYSLPYDVEWLCEWCHGREHRRPSVIAVTRGAVADDLPSLRV